MQFSSDVNGVGFCHNIVFEVMLAVGLTVDSYDMQNSIQSINPQYQLVAAGKGKILKLFKILLAILVS